MHSDDLIYSPEAYSSKSVKRNMSVLLVSSRTHGARAKRNLIVILSAPVMAAKGPGHVTVKHFADTRSVVSSVQSDRPEMTTR